MFRTLILALPFVLMGPAFAADNDDIDCANAMNQMAMNYCADKDFQAADKKLNDAYRTVMKTLDDKGLQAKFKAAQRAWLQFRDAECTFEVAPNEGGSIYPMEYSGCVKRLTEARTKDFENYLVCWKDAAKCPG